MQNIKQLISKMTLEQKLCQLTQTNANIINADTQEEITGMPGELYLQEAQVRELGSVLNGSGIKVIQDKYLSRSKCKIPLSFMMDVVHGCRTIFPVPLAMGCTFDEEIVEDCAKMSAIEAKSFGIAVTFSPMVDLARDARWGRVMETTSEDHYLNGKMGRAFIRGYHKGGIGVCLKHFAAYGEALAGRDYNTTDISDYTLREYYLKSYEECMKENPEMVMTSFNALNGVPMNGRTDLLVDLLREEWGFDGVVISDYSGIKEMIRHGYVETEKECAEIAANNQVDMEMMSSTYIRFLPELVKEGKVKEETIDKMLERVLLLKQKFGLFENPYFGADEEKAKELALCEKHRELVRTAAEKACVLLKNENVLPLEKTENIALIGPFVDEKTIIGAWACYGKPYEAVSVREGVERLLGREIIAAKGVEAELLSEDESGIAEAVEVAKNANIIVACLGELKKDSAEGRSRADISIPKVQIALLKALKALNKPIVSVVFGGRPQVLTELEKYSDAILYAWQPGTEGGSAIARLLFGEVAPTGRLTMSFPRATGQCPIFYNEYFTGRPRIPDTMENQLYRSAYIDCLNSPLYPFGYGLTYTEFEYSDPIISKSELKRGESLTVSVTVKNVGQRAGETTAQLYLRDRYASHIRPKKELKGYQKVFLQPNEEKTVEFTIDEETLKFWTARGKFEAENGEFIAWILENSTLKNGVNFRLVD